MYNVDEIIRLSSEEGLNDREIADILNCNRVSITRIRSRNGILKCNKSNKKDKSYVCINCGQTVYIRRKELSKGFCKNCSTILT